jgi:RNA polymerase sigma factor (sigma-70 family)
MAASRAGSIIQHLRQTVLRRDTDCLSDGQLLDTFISDRDEPAFEALVQRHAAMVWGVCQRILRHEPDAEDAFQATFLVLARKARSVSPREKVASWLYGVAYQTAVRARATTMKRQLRERQVTDMPEPPAAEPNLWDNVRPVLDRELARLPDRYREVIILCDLEGRTRREVARRLTIPEGTVASRLATGRRLLAKRLARHGLVVTGGTLALALAQSASSACAPTAVVSATIATATQLASGQITGIISVKVAELMEGVLKAMLITKLKTMATVLLILGTVTFGAGLLGHGPALAQPGGPDANARSGDRPLRAEIVPGTLIERYTAAFADGGEPAQEHSPEAHDEMKLHGEWSPVVGNANGNVTLLFGPGAALRILVESGSDKKGTYTVDWTTKPFHLDVRWDGGPANPTIMEFTRDGKLRIESGASDAQRPKAFTNEAMVFTKKAMPAVGSKLADAAAAKDLAIAEFYQRTGKFGAARFHYELIRFHYPETDCAKRATQGIADLQHYRIKLPDGSEGWATFDTPPPLQPAPAVATVPPQTVPPQTAPNRADASATSLASKSMRVDTPVIVILENAKITIKPQTQIHMTPVKTDKGTCVRLEAPGITVEVPRLTIESASQVIEVAGADGTLSVTKVPSHEQREFRVPLAKEQREYRVPLAKAAPRLGKIVVIGNTKTPTETILKLAQLVPGQALEPAAVRMVLERLAALNAAIAVTCEAQDGDYRDLVIMLKE